MKTGTIAAAFRGEAAAPSEMTVDRVLGTFLQVIFSLLMVYVMATVLFTARTRTEVGKLKNALNYYIGMWDEIKKSEPGQLYIGREKALMELQRQMLVVAVEKVMGMEARNCGLDFAERKGSDTGFRSGDVLEADVVFNPRFRRACEYAHSIFSEGPHADGSDRLAVWRSGLRVRVLAVARMELREPGTAVSVSKQPNIITKTNEAWLMRTLKGKANDIHRESLVMQQAAVAHLFKYYYDNPDALMASKGGAEIYRSIKTCFSVPPEQQGLFVDDVGRKLHEHAKCVFRRQGAPLLAAIEQ